MLLLQAWLYASISGFCHYSSIENNNKFQTIPYPAWASTTISGHQPLNILWGLYSGSTNMMGTDMTAPISLWFFPLHLSSHLSALSISASPGSHMEACSQAHCFVAPTISFSFIASGYMNQASFGTHVHSRIKNLKIDRKSRGREIGEGGE